VPIPLKAAQRERGRAPGARPDDALPRRPNRSGPRLLGIRADLDSRTMNHGRRWTEKGPVWFSAHRLGTEPGFLQVEQPHPFGEGVRSKARRGATSRLRAEGGTVEARRTCSRPTTSVRLRTTTIRVDEIGRGRRQRARWLNRYIYERRREEATGRAGRRSCSTRRRRQGAAPTCARRAGRAEEGKRIAIDMFSVG